MKNFSMHPLFSTEFCTAFLEKLKQYFPRMYFSCEDLFAITFFSSFSNPLGWKIIEELSSEGYESVLLYLKAHPEEVEILHAQLWQLLCKRYKNSDKMRYRALIKAERLLVK